MKTQSYRLTEIALKHIETLEKRLEAAELEKFNLKATITKLEKEIKNMKGCCSQMQTLLDSNGIVYTLSNKS